MASRSQVLPLLRNAHHQGKLNSDITSEMLPDLAEVLYPYLDRYEAREGSFPSQPVFLAIVKNFLQDGPQVQALLAASKPGDIEAWHQLREYFLSITQKHWPGIGLNYQEEIVSQTLIRTQRYLPGFLFISRFSTWMYKIWQNECWRLIRRIKTQQAWEFSLDEADDEGMTWGDKISTSELSPQEVTEINQTTQAFWERLSRLETELNVRILQLRLAGYKLEEIKTELGQSAPSVSTIKRRIDKIMISLKEDDIIKQIAQQLGLLSAES